MLKKKNKIIIAPLNWGIGHATRCIPIINELLKKGFEPIICSDGDALTYLINEFPLLKSYELPSYNIKYTKNSLFLKVSLFFQAIHIKKIVRKEHQIIHEIIENEGVIGVISDNRFGVYNINIPSVYITHQINVLSGITTFFTSKIHQNIMKKFDEIWVPDTELAKLSGKLSILNNFTKPIKFIGVLSRFQQQSPKTKTVFDILVLLSGTEPQRTILEKKLIFEFKNKSEKVLFVRGLISSKTTIKNTTNIQFINFLTQTELSDTIKKSELIIARSGYSTIMDLAVLQKKCFFIPTPNQSEQEYLAKNLSKLKIAPFSKQSDFTFEKLSIVNNYSGFNSKIGKEVIPLDIFNIS